MPIQVFQARWSGEPETVDLHEGVLLRWFTPDMLGRLNLSPGLGDLLRRHAAEHPPAGSPPPPTRLLQGEAPQGTELHIVGVHLFLEDAHGRILLGLRHPDSAYAGNTWHFLAGHCEREEAVSCLIREAEEIGASGEQGVPGEEFDRIFVSYAMERVPTALVEQLAPGGRLLVHVTSASPSWPGLAVVERTCDGPIAAELRAVEFAHRAGHGMERIWLSEEFRRRINAEPGTWTQRSMLAPPADADRGLWLAADHLLGGLVRDFGAEHLVIGAPGCGSWLRVEPVSDRRWNITTRGPRDIWKEIQDLAARWRAAGSPSRYRLHIDPGGGQRAASACGRLSWPLPALRQLDEGSAA